MTTRIEDSVTYQQTWDYENRLTSVTDQATGEVTTFTYDADGALVKKESPSGTAIYVGDHYELQEEVIGEAGQTSVKHWSKTVLLEHAYENPVVFAQPPSYVGGQHAVVRITDVQSDRFTLYVDEAPNHDGYHPWETVSYVVLEAGSWELADGTRLEVGKLDTMATVGRRVSNQWAQVTFDASFAAAPVVLSQVQTNNDPEWVKTRQQAVAASGFQVALEEAEVMTQPHSMEEVIGWLAIEAGAGEWNGHSYEAGQTPPEVTDAWFPIGFEQSLGQAPRFVASLASYNDADNAHLRYDNLGATMVQVKVEEDTTYDSETNHNGERVHYLAVEGDGLLAGWSSEPEPRSYYFFNGQRIAMRRDGVLYYIAGDHLGTTSVVLDANGDKVAESRHYPYGEERWSDGAIPTDYRFTGQRHDGYIELYAMGARFYDAALGRWISADTLVPDPANPQSFNRYSWVLGNPLKFRDPSGHMEIYGGNPYEPYSDYWYTYVNPDAPGCQVSTAAVERASSLAVDFTPVVGDLKGLAEVATGRDLITGEELGNWRWAGLFGLVGLAELRHLRHADEAGDAFRLLFKVEDAVGATGQWHHMLSTKVMRALEGHQTLHGVFKKSDFLIRAWDLASHRGYQTWHRAYDDEILRWLADPANAEAMQKEFLEFLLEIYSRPDMLERFSGAVDLLNQALEALE